MGRSHPCRHVSSVPCATQLPCNELASHLCYVWVEYCIPYVVTAVVGSYMLVTPFKKLYVHPGEHVTICATLDTGKYREAK